MNFTYLIGQRVKGLGVIVSVTAQGILTIDLGGSFCERDLSQVVILTIAN